MSTIFVDFFDFQVHKFGRVFICWMEMKFMNCVLSRDLNDAKNAKCENVHDFPNQRILDEIR